MNLRHTKLALWMLAVLCLAGAGVCWYAATNLPLAECDQAIPHGHDAQLQTSTSPNVLPDRVAVERVAGHPLRKPFIVETKTIAKRIPPITFKVTGTIIQPDGNIAIFQMRGGDVAMKRVGEKIEQAEILDITPDAVTVLYFDQKQTLKVAPTH